MENKDIIKNVMVRNSERDLGKDLERYNTILDYLKKNPDRAKENEGCIYAIQREAVNGWCSELYNKKLTEKHKSLFNKTNSILSKIIFKKLKC